MKSITVSLRFAILTPLLFGLTGCLNMFGFGEEAVPPSERQLPASTQALLALKGMTQEAPIFIRIFKEESELEVWKLKNGSFQLFKTYGICAWSGTLGPKVQQGDKQAPEGFYTIGAGQLNPHSLYHLAFNIGFPNAYDRANNHSGSALMIHGNCKSAGCYAMTDAYIEEIYVLAREALAAGQTHFHVQALPFRMTAANMQRHADNPWYPFWSKLKEGYDAFETSGKPPLVKVCAKQYLVNVKFTGAKAEPAPDAACPVFAKVDPAALPGVEGVPQTLYASLTAKDQATPQSAASPLAASVASLMPSAAPALASLTLSSSPAPVAPVPAAIQAAPALPAQVAVASPPVQNANPSTARAIAVKPSSVMASLQPERSLARKAIPAIKTPGAADSASQASIRVAAANIVPPVELAPAPAPPVSQPSLQTDIPSKDVDPDALQKPNRAAKGGKLTAPAQSVAGNDGPAYAGYGFSGQVR